jgi:transcription elongation GreA/GreB family factor
LSQELKLQLYKHCLDYVNHQIDIINRALDDAQSAANDETKNSAGDKYETGRAMKQRESELLVTRLNDVHALQKTLHHIDISKNFDTVKSGALITTSMGIFFIAISADEIVINGEEYCFISQESPIGAAMLHCKAGESFRFRDRTVKVITVE